TQASATGANTKQIVFSIRAATTNMAAAATTASDASRTVIAPIGISRAAVRGLRASYSRSTMRLNPIAANRAVVNATTTHHATRAVTSVVKLASVTPTSANGRAKSVCGSLTKLAYRTTRDDPAMVCH